MPTRFTPIFPEASVLDTTKGDPFSQLLTYAAKAGYVYGFTEGYTMIYQDFLEMLKTVDAADRPFLQKLMDTLADRFHENCDGGLDRAELHLSVTQVGPEETPTFH